MPPHSTELTSSIEICPRQGFTCPRFTLQFGEVHQNHALANKLKQSCGIIEWYLLFKKTIAYGIHVLQTWN